VFPEVALEAIDERRQPFGTKGFLLNVPVADVAFRRLAGLMTIEASS
jgi:hypothetical protein